jgi:hypothetical protein
VWRQNFENGQLIRSFYIYFFCALIASTVYGQQDTTASAPSGMAQDDPSNFATRGELFNGLQRLQSGEFFNVTTARSIIAMGKRFTTRVDVPFVQNTTPGTGYDQQGLGDISVRLLGYRIYKSPKAALLTSVEFSFNTAQSPLLGTGKNVIIPVVAYSWLIPKSRTIMAVSFQQYNSVSGDKTRREINFTRIQMYWIKGWSKKIWTVAMPELYVDYIKDGLSMNVEATTAYRFKGRFNVWVKGGVGVFGDHPSRYQWKAETGIRYMLIRKRVTK